MVARRAALATLVLVLGLVLASGCGGRGGGEADGGATSVTPASTRAASTGSEGTGEATPAPAPARPGPGAPVRLSIARLGLDEDLLGLGLTTTGALEVPGDPSRVGWFTGGGRPGSSGPTVLVGHLDSTTGPAVFARLPELAPGDEVLVDSAGGRRTSYVVTDARDVPQDPFPTAAVFGATPEDVLRLITCTGPYDREAGRYTENRIVTAVATPR